MMQSIKSTSPNSSAEKDSGLIIDASSYSVPTVSEFLKISGAALKESHPHDISITKEPPNYSISAHADQ